MLLLIILILLISYPLMGSFGGLLGVVFKNTNRFEYAISTSLIFALLGYYFIPAHEIDLTRYYDIIQQYQIDPPTYLSIIQQQGFFSGANFIFKWIAEIGNLQLLPALVGLITMTVLFYVAADSFTKYQTFFSLRIYILVIIIGLFPLASAFSNVRNVLAAAMVGIAVYRDLQQHKLDVVTILLYLIGLTIHMAVIVVILARLVLLLRFKNRTFIKLIVIGLVITIFFLPPIRNQLLRIIEKGSVYLNIDANNSEYAAYVSSSLYMKLLKLVYFVITLSITCITIANFRRNKGDFNLFTIFICIVTLLTFGMAVPVYLRLLFVLLLIATPQYLQLLQFGSERHEDVHAIILLFVLVFTFGVFIFNCVTFNQYSSLSNALQHIFTFNVTTWNGGHL